MRATVVDTGALFRQIAPLCQDPEEAKILAQDTALRFIQQYPWEEIYCPGLFEAQDEDFASVCLLGTTQEYRSDWIVYSPTMGGSTWEEKWSPGKKKLWGSMAEEVQAMVEEGVPIEKAGQLIRKHLSLEAIIDTIDTIKPKKLIGSIAQAAWNLEHALQEEEDYFLPWKQPIEQVEWAQALFVSIAERQQNESQRGYRLVDTMEKLEDMVTTLSAFDEIALDTETTSLDPYELELVGVSLSAEPQQSYYIPVGHRKGRQLDETTVVKALLPLLYSKLIVFTNFSYDGTVLAKVNVDIDRIKFFDNLLAAYLGGYGVSSGEKGARVGLKAITKRLQGIVMMEISDLIGDKVTFDYVPIKTAVSYAAADSDMTFRNYGPLRQRIEELGMEDLLAMEQRFTRLIMQMEANGCFIDVELAKDLDAIFKKEISKQVNLIYEYAGEEFVIGNPAEVARILYDKLGLPPGKKNLTAFATDKTHLESIQHLHPIAESIIEYRAMSKLQSTYAENLIGFIHPATGRLHSSWNQARAETGRLSSSEGPKGGLNMQNIPSRSDLGKAIRLTFMPQIPDDYQMVVADASQIELRVLAHFSQDQAMIDDFLSGVDFHERTASRMFRKPQDQITKGQRSIAKNFNFGVSYLISAKGAATRFKMSEEEAQELIDLYYNTYPRIREYQNETIFFCRQHGYTETILGRRRWYPDINSDSRKFRAEAERACVNLPIQGTAADVIKLWMLDIDEWVAANGYRNDQMLLMQVHDEVVYEVKNELCVPMLDYIKGSLTGVGERLGLAVPLLAEGDFGGSWGEVK